MNRKLNFIIIIILTVTVYFIYTFFNTDEENIKYEYNNEPAHVVESEDGSLPFVVLTEKAVQRLDIQIIKISDNQRSIPYSSVVYDVNGKTWVYVNSDSFFYKRKQIFIEKVEGNDVLLSELLPNDIDIVTIGVPELYGVEYGVGQGGVGH